MCHRSQFLKCEKWAKVAIVFQIKEVLDYDIDFHRVTKTHRLYGFKFVTCRPQNLENFSTWLAENGEWAKA